MRYIYREVLQANLWKFSIELRKFMVLLHLSNALFVLINFLSS